MDLGYILSLSLWKHFTPGRVKGIAADLTVKKQEGYIYHGLLGSDFVQNKEWDLPVNHRAGRVKVRKGL